MVIATKKSVIGVAKKTKKGYECNFVTNCHTLIPAKFSTLLSRLLPNTTIEQQSLLRCLICEMIKIQMHRAMLIIGKQKGHENLPMLVYQGPGKNGTVG